jgi:hypothetical protein
MKLTTETVRAAQAWLAASTLLAIAQASADSPAAARPIYRCELRGQSVFSDRPCGSDASTYEADTARVSITESAPVKAAPMQDSKPERRRGSAGGNAQARARHAATCERIESGLREIRARMRSGYSAKQGERLKERQQALQVERRAARCS